LRSKWVVFDAYDEGAAILPRLYAYATELEVGWQTQLVARIVYERMARAEVIQSVREHDWRSYPPYAKPGFPILRFEEHADGTATKTVIPMPPGHVAIPKTGASSIMGEHVLPVLREAGLWYYYIEQVWKQTGEGPPAMKFDHLFMERWVGWCAAVVKEQPEKIWWARAVADRLETSDFKDWRERHLFIALVELGESDAVPVLVRRFDDWFRADTYNREAYPGSWKTTYPRRFSKIMAFANANQVEIVESAIRSEPMLSPLIESIADLRSRNQSDESARIVFRFGATNVENSRQR
jgi:hypothetical protein